MNKEKKIALFGYNPKSFWKWHSLDLTIVTLAYICAVYCSYLQPTISRADILFLVYAAANGFHSVALHIKLSLNIGEGSDCLYRKRTHILKCQSRGNLFPIFLLNSFRANERRISAKIKGSGIKRMNEKNRKKKSGKARQFPSGHAAARHNALDVILGFTRRREIKKKTKGKNKRIFYLSQLYDHASVGGRGGTHKKELRHSEQCWPRSQKQGTRPAHFGRNARGRPKGGVRIKHNTRAAKWRSPPTHRDRQPGI